MILTVYGDELRDFGLISKEDVEEYSMFNVVDVPDDYVFLWYVKNQDDFDTETEYELGENADCTFENWINNVYVCDDFDGFFTFTNESYGWLPNVNNIMVY